MPPVNTPTAASPTARTPSRPQTPSTAARPLTPLSYLSSPAPDLASTLYTSQADDQADEANISFLRDSLDTLRNLDSGTAYRTQLIDPQRDPRRQVYRQENLPGGSEAQHEAAQDQSRRDRLQRVLARLNSLHDPATSSSAAYSNRTPSPSQQNIYDWAPGHDENNTDENELDAILSELRRQQPDTHPDILRVLGQSQLDAQRQRVRERDGSGAAATDVEQRRSVLRERERTRRDSEWINLRSRAVLQRARQEGAGSPSSTERMLRYVMERERSGMSEEEERARGTGWFRPSPSRGSGSGEHASGVSRFGQLDVSNAFIHATIDSSRDPRIYTNHLNGFRDRDRQERVDAFRRGYLAENVPPRLPRISTPPVPPIESRPRTQVSLLERAMKYLSDLRSCSRYEDSLSAAIQQGLATKGFFADNHEDFPMDVDELPDLQQSSWLQPGAVFEGHQHATTTISPINHPGPTASSRIEQINPNYSSGPTMGFDHPPGSTQIASYDATRPWLSHHPPPYLSSKAPHDQWPVRVTIHSVDHEKMTLQATMEAYDVPQHPTNTSFHAADRPRAGKKHAPITTYVEGHVIDLRTHTFLTPDERENKRRKIGPHETSVENRTPYTTIPQTTAFPSATPQTDAQNWVKLEPFLSLAAKSSSRSAEDTIARTLLSKASLEQLSSEYIFMRWKEKCFVHGKEDTCSASVAERSGDQDRGHGLTISGFYYVSLRRADGAVEGLYFDPSTTPYQCLRLMGRGGMVGAWEFR